LSMSERYMKVDGNATPKDVETMLQLVYLYFTSIKKDNDTFNQQIKQMETMLKNRELSPETALSDSLTATLYGHNPRLKPFLSSDLKDVNYDRILQMAKERTANANGNTLAQSPKSGFRFSQRPYPIVPFSHPSHILQHKGRILAFFIYFCKKGLV